MKKKIYITTSNFHLDKKIIMKYFSKKKFQIINSCIGRKYKEKEIINKFSDAYAIIAGTEKYSLNTINSFKNLKYISRCGVGTDSIDLDAIKKNKIRLLKTKKSHSNIVAEHAIAGLFSCLKNIINFNFELKNKKWKKSNLDTLYNKRIGFYGYGKIAKQIHKMLKIFGNDFYYYDLNKVKNSSKIKRLNSLNMLFKLSDVVFICASLVNNRYFINKEILRDINSKKIIINTSRGELINEKDLINFLKKNKKSIYFTDVFSNEPYYGPMIKLKNGI